MLEILDALRRIVSRWVETVTPINADVNIGDTLLYVDSTKRFQSGDEVMIEDPIEGEPNLIIEEILDNTTLRLATPVMNYWDTDRGIVLRKLVNNMFVEGIYIGDRNVIRDYPAITINGTSIDSDWMTLDSTEEEYNVELQVLVEAATKEDGYRFVWKIAKVIQEGLKKNIFPLVDNYDMTSVTGDILTGDEVIRVADSSIFNTELTDTASSYPRLSDARLIIEDRWKSEETRVQRILSETEILIAPVACQNFAVVNNSIAIRPKRFIFNSWPKQIVQGNTSNKGTLLQAATIRWFAKEEVPVDFKNNDPHLK